MKAVLKYYWQMIKKRKWMFLFLCLVVLLHVSMEVYWAMVLKDMADYISMPFTPELFDDIIGILIIASIFWGGHLVMWRLFEIINPYFQLGGVRDLNEITVNNIFQKKYQYFQNEFSGSLVKKMGRFHLGFEPFTDWIFFTLLDNILFLIVSFVVLFQFDPIIAWIVILFGVVFMIISGCGFLWKMKYDKISAEADSKVGAVVADSFSNIFAVKSAGVESKEKFTINNIIDDWRSKTTTAWHLSALIFGIQHFLFITFEVGVLWWCALQWQAGDFSIGEFVLYQSVVLLLVLRIWEFGRQLRNLFKTLADASEIVEIMERIEEEADSSTAKHHKIEKGEIEFRNMSFEYESGGLFKDFNLKISAGKKVALVGHSGSGKTTLTNLLFRFFEPQRGGIYFDDIQSRDFTYQSLRSQISLVPQHPEMFHRTLRENIILGKEVSDEQIWEALKKAQGYDFAKNLEEGLDTMIGERGVKLSGGEKQRVAIARAFLDASQIVVLDEATSALDSITEAELQKGIFNLIENKTAIVIAHRLSTVMQMDRIVVMERGKVIEEGTHEALIQKKGKYAEMWEHQRGGFLGEE